MLFPGRSSVSSRLAAWPLCMACSGAWPQKCCSEARLAGSAVSRPCLSNAARADRLVGEACWLTVRPGYRPPCTAPFSSLLSSPVFVVHRCRCDAWSGGRRLSGACARLLGCRAAALAACSIGCCGRATRWPSELFVRTAG
jgi:hypothetical protein